MVFISYAWIRIFVIVNKNIRPRIKHDSADFLLWLAALVLSAFFYDRSNAFAQHVPQVIAEQGLKSAFFIVCVFDFDRRGLVFFCFNFTRRRFGDEHFGCYYQQQYGEDFSQ